MNSLPRTGTIYFLGIGGIGMSALARYFMKEGWQVHGYDKTRTSLTDSLQQEGMVIHYEDNISLIPEKPDLVVLTPAVPADLGEYIHLRNSGIPILKRAEVLGLISQNYRTIAIAGTHGKTTTTTLITHLLQQTRIGCNAFLGGISKNFDSNLVISKISSLLVVEADEFDRSFLHLQPNTAIITSIDADHLDIYGDYKSLMESFIDFTRNIVPGGILLLKAGLNLPGTLTGQIRVFRYSMDQRSDFYASNIQLEGGLYHFDFIHPDGVIQDLVLGLPGLYNVENAVAAIAASWLNGAEEKALRAGLATFSGVKRRFDVRVSDERHVYIDDYAHHPAELAASISSARALFPGRKLTGIFQPHLYSRTRDFADEFAQSLDLLDEVILLPIYPARERPIPGITSEMLLSKIQTASRRLVQMKDIPGCLDPNSLEVLMTLGAGDIDTLAYPIEQYLKKA